MDSRRAFLVLFSILGIQEIVVERPTAQKPHPPIWTWALVASARSARWLRRATICCSASTPHQRMLVTPSPYSKKRARWTGAVLIRCRLGRTRAFFVTDTRAQKDAAMERRVQVPHGQLKLATRPDGTVHGGPAPGHACPGPPWTVPSGRWPVAADACGSAAGRSIAASFSALVSVTKKARVTPTCIGSKRRPSALTVSLNTAMA